MAAARRLQWKAGPRPALISWGWQCLLTGAASAAGLGVRAGPRGGGAAPEGAGGSGGGGRGAPCLPLSVEGAWACGGRRAESWGEKWAGGRRPPGPIHSRRGAALRGGGGGEQRGWAGGGGPEGEERRGEERLCLSNKRKRAGPGAPGGRGAATRGARAGLPGGAGAGSQRAPRRRAMRGSGSLCFFSSDVKANGALGRRRAERAAAAAALGEADPAGCWGGRAARPAAEERVDHWQEERWDGLRRAGRRRARVRPHSLRRWAARTGPGLFSCWRRCLAAPRAPELYEETCAPFHQLVVWERLHVNVTFGVTWGSLCKEEKMTVDSESVHSSPVYVPFAFLEVTVEAFTE